jgi:hypothetical protein
MMRDNYDYSSLSGENSMFCEQNSLFYERAGNLYQAAEPVRLSVPESNRGAGIGDDF